VFVEKLEQRCALLLPLHRPDGLASALAVSAMTTTMNTDIAMPRAVNPDAFFC
jgi:hypothetical protein